MTTQSYIKAQAKKKGFSLRRLAAEAGINYQSLYSALSRDNGYISEDMLDRISSALGLEKDSLSRSLDPSTVASNAMVTLIDTIYSIVGSESQSDREDMLYLINSFLEANADLIRDIHDQLKKGGKRK